LLVTAFVIFLIAWNRGIYLLYGMFWLVVSTLVISYVFPRWSLKGITVRRTHPASAFEGNEIPLTVELINNSVFSKSMLEIVDQVPMAVPGEREPMSFVARLKRKSRHRFNLLVKCDYRGLFDIGPMELKSGFPLGITNQSRSVNDSVTQLLVYPTSFAITNLPITTHRPASSHGIDSLAGIGGNEDFFGIREYRRGDSPRFIHWRSTARHQNLIVKEFETRISTELSLVLDLDKSIHGGTGKESTLEYMVKIAASIAQYALNKGHDVQLIGKGENKWDIPSGRGLPQFGKLLEILARVKANGLTSYPDVIRQSQSMIRDGATAVLFFCNPDQFSDDYRYVISLLRARRIQPLAVILDYDSFNGLAKPKSFREGKLANFLAGEGCTTVFVSQGEELESLFC